MGCIYWMLEDVECWYEENKWSDGGYVQCTNIPIPTFVLCSSSRYISHQKSKISNEKEANERNGTNQRTTVVRIENSTKIYISTYRREHNTYRKKK